MHLTELDAVIGRQAVECHRIDYGPGGLLAAIRAIVYAELGLAAPGLEDQTGLPVPAGGAGPGAAPAAG